MTDYCGAISDHYLRVWSTRTKAHQWRKGPSQDLPTGFHILEFEPSPQRNMWTYSTCCMSQPNDSSRVELHLFSPYMSESLVELLTVVAHYHRTGASLDLGHTVNFGRPWLPESTCSYGLVSLPYLDGPALENLCIPARKELIKFYWLVPITKEEMEFKRTNGLPALEERFERTGLNYIDPLRKSVV
jgi:Suppressor of fused protein (SUFU)